VKDGDWVLMQIPGCL